MQSKTSKTPNVMNNPQKAFLLRNKMTPHPCHGEQNYYLALCKFAYIGEIKPAVSGIDLWQL